MNKKNESKKTTSIEFKAKVEYKDTLAILEQLEKIEENDPELAKNLLKQFNDLSSRVGKIVLDREKSEDKGEGDDLLRKTQEELSKVISKIMSSH